MLKSCVIGDPIHHSLSPIVHGHWLAQYGINGTYTAVQAPNLPQTLSDLQNQGFAGCNVTIPHKESVMELCDEISPTATAIGAVNTVVFRPDGTVYGTNTDAYGFTKNALSPTMDTAQAVILGAGGACRAVVYALREQGFTNIHIANRTVARAETLATDFATPNCHITTGDLDSVADKLPDCTLLINTTSLGMVGQPPLNISLKNLPKSAVVTDIIYTPLITPLLALAQQNGNLAIDGLGMLLHQAVPGFALWYNHTPTVTSDLRTHVLQVLP